MLPFTSGCGDVHILLVPGEHMFERYGPLGHKYSGDEVQLSTARTYQRVSAAQVDEQPLLQKAVGVVWEQRALEDELNAVFDLKLRLTRRQAAARQLGSDN